MAAVYSDKFILLETRYLGPFLVSNSVYSLRNLLKLKKQGMLIPDDMMEMIPPLLGEASSLYLAGKLDVLT